MDEQPRDGAVRVGLVLDRLTTGGTERQMELLISRAPAHVVFSICSFGSDEDAAARFRALAPTLELSRGPVRDLTLARELGQWASAARCDIVLAPHRFAGLIAKLARLNGLATPVVCALRGRSRFSLKQRLQYDHIDLHLMRLASAVIVNGESLVDRLPRWPWLRKKVSCILNGVVLTQPPSRVHRNKWRSQNGWSTDEIIVASMGRLVDVKAPLQAVRAVASLRDRGIRARLLWIGDGPMRAEIEADGSAPREWVQCTGFVSETRRWLSAADIYLHPSYWENTSNAILEAMSLSLPVVARRTGGNPELLAVGDAGVLYDTDNELAGVLEHLVNNPAVASQLGRTALRPVRDRYSVERMVDCHVELLERCVRRS